MTEKLQRSLSGGYEVKISDYLSRGFDIFKANAGAYIGYTILYFVISFFINLIPFLNIFGSILISPCLVFGFHLVSKSISADNIIPDFGMYFKGFDHFGKLVVIALLSMLLYVVLFLPLIGTIGFSAFSMANANANEIMETLIGGPLFVLVLTMCVFLYLAICWIFSSMLAVFHDMSAWDAMETSRKLVTRNWFMIFIFCLLVGIIAISGTILLVIGLIVTVPLAFCYLYAAFEDIAGVPGAGDEFADDGISEIGEDLTRNFDSEG